MKTLMYSVLLAVCLFFYVKGYTMWPLTSGTGMSKQVEDTYRRIKDDMNEDKNRTPPPAKDDKRKEEDHKRDRADRDKGKIRKE